MLYALLFLYYELRKPSVGSNTSTGCGGSVMRAGLGGLDWGVEGSCFVRSKMNVIENYP